MKRTILLSGGRLDTDFALAFLRDNDYDELFAVDGGLRVCDVLGIKPDRILGDFDTVERSLLQKYEDMGIPIETYPPKKDDTDTELAMNYAIDGGSTQIFVLGATGGRLDHFIGNVHLLKIAMARGCQMYIVDPCNRISLLSGRTELYREEQYGTYVSLIPFTDVVKNVTLTGFRYCLKDETLFKGHSIGISNVICSDTAEIDCTEGLLLMIESKDDLKA